MQRLNLYSEFLNAHTLLPEKIISKQSESGTNACLTMHSCTVQCFIIVLHQKIKDKEKCLWKEKTVIKHTHKHDINYVNRYITFLMDICKR